MLRALLLCPSLVQAAPVIPPGFAFLGTGYDLFQGNPLDTTGMGDPGYKNAIFELSTKQARTTLDGKWSYPDFTNLKPVSECVANESNYTYSNFSDYTDNVNMSFAAGVNYTGNFSNSAKPTPLDEYVKGFKFNFNINTKHMSENLKDKKIITVEEKYVCSVYKLAMDTFACPPFTRNFQMAVKMMKTTYEGNEEFYGEVMRSFGTHVLTGFEAGGRWAVQSSFKKDDVENMLATGHDFNLGISTSGKIAAGFSIGDNVAKSASTKVLEIQKSNATYNIGGEFSTDPKTWKESVSAHPMPIGGLVPTPIHFYLTSDFFPDDKEISAKKTAYMKAVGAYCKVLEKSGVMGVKKCTAPPTDLEYWPHEKIFV